MLSNVAAAAGWISGHHRRMTQPDLTPAHPSGAVAGTFHPVDQRSADVLMDDGTCATQSSECSSKVQQRISQQQWRARVRATWPFHGPADERRGRPVNGPATMIACRLLTRTPERAPSMRPRRGPR